MFDVCIWKESCNLPETATLAAPGLLVRWAKHVGSGSKAMICAVGHSCDVRKGPVHEAHVEWLQGSGFE